MVCNTDCGLDKWEEAGNPNTNGSPQNSPVLQGNSGGVTQRDFPAAVLGISYTPFWGHVCECRRVFPCSLILLHSQTHAHTSWNLRGQNNSTRLLFAGRVGKWHTWIFRCARLQEAARPPCVCVCAHAHMQTHTQTQAAGGSVRMVRRGGASKGD